MKYADWYGPALARIEELTKKMVLSPTQRLDDAEQAEYEELSDRVDAEYARVNPEPSRWKQER